MILAGSECNWGGNIVVCIYRKQHLLTLAGCVKKYMLKKNYKEEAGTGKDNTAWREEGTTKRNVESSPMDRNLQWFDFSPLSHGG